ncbi:MAG: CotH kinase family protein [Clostridia bacterium]|nr:CotH kinase family protein [Clostridia bacterium]
MQKKLLLSLLFALFLLALAACAPTVEIPPDVPPDPPAHTCVFGEWTVSRAATCTEDGEQTRACTCGETETAVIPAAHRYILDTLYAQPEPRVSCGGIFRCEGCGDEEENVVTPADVGMPIVYIDGSFDGMSKENKVEVGFDYMSEELTFSCTATMKWQGATSLAYPKKNFSIQLFEEDGSKKKVELADGWGEESKYCMKANWTDFSEARNLVSADLYGDVAATRDKQDEFAGLVNGGAVDGFPILVYHDGNFLGLYTMNIPKDKWLMGMEKDDTLRQAMVIPEQWHASVSLREFMSYDFASTSWELEFASTEDNPAIGTNWVVDSFNEMMLFLMSNDGESLKAGLDKYINVDRAIDALIFTWVICGKDNYSKNILWTTFDGKVWTPCVYDLDSTWGLWWDASKLNTPGEVTNFKNSSVCLLYQRLRYNYQDEILARYQELRATVLSDAAIEERFNAYFESIPDAVYAAERERWPNRVGLWIEHESQILSFAKEHLAILDVKIANNTW